MPVEHRKKYLAMPAGIFLCVVENSYLYVALKNNYVALKNNFQGLFTCFLLRLLV